MSAPINIRNNAAREPHTSISLKDRVVRSFSLRKGSRSTSSSKSPAAADSRNTKDGVLSSSASPVASPTDFIRSRHSVDSRRPTSSGSGTGFGVRAFGFGTKPSSPLAQSSFTPNPFENDTVTLSPSAHGLTGAHSKVSTSVGANAARTLAVPPSPSFQPKRVQGTRQGHSHSQSHNNISLLSRSLSRSKYLGGGGGKERKVEQKEESHFADDSYLVVSPSSSSRSPLSNSNSYDGSGARLDRQMGKVGKATRSRSITRQLKNAATTNAYPDDRDRDADSLLSQRPLLRSRSFDSLVPSLLGDYAPSPRILVQSTKRAEPLERLSAPLTKNVFSIQRMPWAEEDDDGSGARGDVDQALPAQRAGGEGEGGQEETGRSRERAQTADGRLGLLKAASSSANHGKADEFELMEDLKAPIMLRTSSASTIASSNLHQTHLQQHRPPGSSSLPPPSPARSPATSPALAATRMTGGSTVAGGESGQQRSLREHWTRELEGKMGPFIVVERGWKKGIYTSGEEAARQIRDFPGPKVRKVDSAAEAIDIIAAHQPVTPSATTAEGLLARSGSLRNNVASSYGAAGARAGRFLGLDVAEEEGVDGEQVVGGAVPSASGESRRGVGRGPGGGGAGLSYAARRAARLRAEAEAREKAASGSGDGDGEGEGEAEANGDQVGSLAEDGGRRRRRAEYGRSSMDAFPSSARGLVSFEEDHQARDSHSYQQDQASPMRRGFSTRDRTRTRSGGLGPSPSLSRQKQQASTKRPSTANRAAELEYGFLVDSSSDAAAAARREQGAGAPRMGYAYASALGATVTVQRAHTISGAR
ncbi:unnamed protein product [Tilletia controversa]|nr:unnamed protein product [Tilletia controversa]CAD6982955.1 unnamed protein product [Tilletia controversa]